MILKRRSKPDRRRRKRQLLNTSVQVFTESAQLDGLGINLSDVGMCLFTMANLQVGSQIQVEFRPFSLIGIPLRLAGPYKTCPTSEACRLGKCLYREVEVLY